MVEPGTALPTSTLTLPLALSGATTTTLAAYRDRWLVLYFYPKDSTPGCTTEGLGFNALLPAFAALDCDVLGVSRDTVRSHDHFCAKQGFAFPLVSDADEALCRAFDVIREKNMYGRTVLGIERSTFLLDPGARVAAAWRKVKVAGHPEAVLDALRTLQAK